MNCATFVGGECISKMANGEDWKLYFGKNNTIACPRELSFGTKIELDGNVYTCRDRGGKIILTENNEYWIDILTEHTHYKYGEIKTAYILGD